MPPLNISAREVEDTRRIAQIMINIEKKKNDSAFANTVTDELYHHQPFLLSMIMGYKLDISSSELQELVKLYTLIWEFYKNEPAVRSVIITQQHYERVEKANVLVLQQSGTIKSNKEKERFIESNLNKATSKALFAVVFMEFKESMALRNMDNETKATLLIGLQSVIQCFDEVAGGKIK